MFILCLFLKPNSIIMQFGTFNYPVPANEPVLTYAPGSAEKLALKQAIASLKKKSLDIPMIINGKEVNYRV